MMQNRRRLSRKRRTGKKIRSPDRLMTPFRQSELNRNNKYWGRSNHRDHGASRGEAISRVIPVFPAPPVVEPMYYSSAQSHRFQDRASILLELSPIRRPVDNFPESRST